MKLKYLLLALTVGTGFSPLAGANSEAQDAAHYFGACQRTELLGFDGVIEGHTRLCSYRSDRLSALVNAYGVSAGDAFTVWWVYFDDPQACVVPGECGLADFEGENPLGVFGRMDSAIVGRHGRAHFYDTLRGLNPSPGSQVWLLMFGHGPANDSDNRHRARQLLTPEDPLAGAPHLGNVVDGPLGFPAAVSIFQF